MSTFPYDSSSFLKDLFFVWIFPQIRYFKSTDPTIHNVFELPKKSDLTSAYKILKKNWHQETKKVDPNFFSVILKTIKKDLIRVCLMILLSIYLNITQAVLINFIIDHLQSNDQSSNIGLILGCSFISASILSCCLKHNGTLLCLMLTGKIKGLVSLMVSEKLLKIHNCVLQNDNNQAKILNVIGTDLEVLELSVYVIYFCCLPFTITAAIIVILIIFGYTGLIGIGISVLHVPLVIGISRIAMKTKLRVSKISDSRIKMIQNLIEGLKMLKMYTWELPFLDKIHKIRKSEIERLRKSVYLTGILGVLATAGSNLNIFATLSIHIILFNSLSPGKFFMLVTLYSITHNNIVYLSTTGASTVFSFINTSKRITEILLLDEYRQDYAKPVLEESLCLHNLTFSWKSPEKVGNKEENNDSDTELVRTRTIYRDCLRDISINIYNSEFTMVVGPVGCGKSSFLLGILGELQIIFGDLYRPSSISYCSEKPWLISESIKNNILMGRAYNPDRYSEVIEACKLKKDFEQFQDADETILTDKGQNLSEGQKARISLARAVYSDSTIYLLDDPLSAIDTKVSQKIFKSCIKTLLKGKIIVLATHHIEYMQQADNILVLDHGEKIFFGPFDELRTFEPAVEVLGDVPCKREIVEKKAVKVKIRRRESLFRVCFTEDLLESKKNVFFTFWDYFKEGTGGKFFGLFILVLMACSQGIQMLTLYWPSFWLRQSDQGNAYYLEIYAVLLGLCYIFAVLKVFPCLFCLTKSNIILHNKALTGLVFSTSYYFDKNPAGMILNRFSKDISTLDGPLQHFIYETLSHSLTILGYLSLIAAIMPVTLLLIPLILFSWYLLLRNLSSTTIKLRKLELQSKSPILSTLSSILPGLPTIRSLSLSLHFTSLLQSQIKAHQKVYLTFHVFLRFMQLYSDLASTLLLILNIVLVISFKSLVKPELAALSLSTSVSLISVTSLWFKSIIEFKTNLTSVQVLQEFSSMLPEGVFEENTQFLVKNGKIEFKDVCMRYSTANDLALANLNFCIEPGDHIGVVGRTGSGKSSILQVIFRIVSPETGTVCIDDTNIMQIGLTQLRSQISIIPQIPFLFTGTVRENLDPFLKFSDLQILQVLDEVHLKSYVLDHDLTLNTQVSEQGINFSAGQKQLICMGRAILTGNKIVMMDEATANMDNETDKLIQKIIQVKFKSCTLIIVAHRLKTIIHSSKVIVMDNGTCIEYGEPSEVYKRTESLFAKLVDSAPGEEKEYLLKVLN